jgi:hypothetical protein
MLCNNGNQCCAPTSKNTRCSKLTAPGSNHCDYHRPKASSLYFKYKKLSDQIDDYDIYRKFDYIDDRIDHIMKCYVYFNKVFEARTKHRKYSFVPECYDTGHDYQFTRLNNLIEECEKILSELYILKESTSSSYEEESYSSDESIEIEEIPAKDFSRKAEEYRRFRRQREAEIEMWINKYIEENRVILDRRTLLYFNITKCIDKLFNNDDLSLFVKSISLFNMVARLRTIGYFEKTFKPDRCNKPKCGCYIPYDATLGCSCIRYNNTLQKYYNLATEQTLKWFFEILLFNENKLIPLVDDIIDLYYEHGDDVLVLKVHLVWDQIEKRLVLTENHEAPLPKMSAVLATTRLKNKYAYQRLNNLFLNGK